LGELKRIHAMMIIIAKLEFNLELSFSIFLVTFAATI